MKKNYTKLVLLNYIFLLILELIFKLLVLKTCDLGILYIFIYSFPFACLISFFMSLFNNNKLNKFISIVFYLVILFIYAAETVYYAYYKSIAGVSGILYGGQVAEFYESIIDYIKLNILILTSILSTTILIIILNIKKIGKTKLNLKVALVLLISSIALSTSFLQIEFKDESSSKKLMFETNDIIESTNKFGVLSGVSLDAIKLFSDFKEKITLGPTYEFNLNDDIEYNITDIDFDKLISYESDSTIKSMHTYFMSQEPTNKNEYTGIFAGKNLIFITAEGFYPIAVDEKLTPTLYKLVNSSFVFNNYYQPIFSCSTSDGEFINQLSILPGVRLCSMKATEGVYFPYSLGNIMDYYGYKTYAFHGWTYTYYGREKTLPNLGYIYYGYDRFNRGYEYALKGINYSWPTSDIEVVESSYPIYRNDSPFLAYYMSISGHLQYNFTGGNAMATKNKKYVQSVDANDNIKAYIATQIEFDRSMEKLLQKLENDGILDDTVIVISADHYPYGLSNEEIASYADWMKDENFDLYKNNLIIYNSQMEKTEVNKYTSSLDLLPTVLNLFGIKYDSRLLIGNDIFSDADDLVIFNNKSWITSKGRYNYLQKKFESFDGSSVSQEYINDINSIVYTKFQMSKLLVSEDYYRHLGGL